MAYDFRLKQLLDEKGMTQSQLSRVSGVSFVTINRICAGRVQAVALTTLDKIADALGVGICDIIDDKRRRRK